ncbi:hypothetical protein NUACC21_51520 [Scytonema sp. NUACC21]
MFQLFFLKNLLTSLRELSPTMLLISVALHGILLALPISSSLLEKSQIPKMAAKREEKILWFPLPTGKELFSTGDMLVSPKPPELMSPTPTTSEIVLDLPPLPNLTMDLEQQEKLPQKKLQIEEETATEKKVSTAQVLPPISPSPSPPESRSSILNENSPIPEISISDTVDKTHSSLESVNSLPTSPAQPSVEIAPPLQNSEKELFNAIISSLEQEIPWTPNLTFAEPDKFSTSKFGLENIFGAAIDKTPDELAAIVGSKLEVQGFQVSLIGFYGGGPLYEVRKGEFIEYVSFAPTTERTGAIIVTWKTAPV